MTRPLLRLSGRLPWDVTVNRLTQAVGERSGGGLPLVDLTETNPTRVGLPYPEAELAELLRRGGTPEYRPHPLGIPEAREALAAHLSTPEDPVSPDDLVLTASTSESYSYLFKLFADPGHEVLTAAPSYPLLDSLASLDSLLLGHFPLDPDRGFALDPRVVADAISPLTRLLVLVHPGNPTGRFLSVQEQEAISTLCASRGLPFVSDEVFADYPLTEDPRRAGPAAVAAGEETLSFSLGGLSKSAGLPSWKLGWIRVGGPPALRRSILNSLELVADSYLSVATPVQRALAGVLEFAPRIQAAILGRLKENLATLRSALEGLPGIELLEPEGGWSAVLRVARPVSDEELVIGLLATRGRARPSRLLLRLRERGLSRALAPPRAGPLRRRGGTDGRVSGGMKSKGGVLADAASVLLTFP